MNYAEARSLIDAFTVMVNTHHYQPETILALIKKGYSVGFLREKKFAMIKICQIMHKLRLTNESMLEDILGTALS